MSTQPHVTADRAGRLGARRQGRRRRGPSAAGRCSSSPPAPGLSPAAIHKIEKSGMTPTITSLMKVASALGQERRLLHRGVRPAAAGDGRAPRRARAAVHVQAGPRRCENVSGRYGPFFVAGAEAFVEPRADSGPEPMVHPGEELVVLLEGEMSFDVDGEHYDLERGRLDPLPHQRARTRGPTRPTARRGRSGWRSAARRTQADGACRRRLRRQRADPRRTSAARGPSRRRNALRRPRARCSSCAARATRSC